MKHHGWLAILTVSSIFSLSAFAEDHREQQHWHGDIKYFHEHDHNLWRSGHWFQGAHSGRSGWWWVVNGIWYFYPRKVAAIPDPYVPPTVTVVQAAPPVVIQQAPPPPAAIPAQPQAVAPPAAPANWYYCNNPHGYYPYVTACQGEWTTVPATPPAPPSP